MRAGGGAAHPHLLDAQARCVVGIGFDQCRLHTQDRFQGDSPAEGQRRFHGSYVCQDQTRIRTWPLTDLRLGERLGGGREPLDLRRRRGLGAEQHRGQWADSGCPQRGINARQLCGGVFRERLDRAGKRKDCARDARRDRGAVGARVRQKGPP